MTLEQTGQQRTLEYLQRLLRTLPEMAEQYGLDTQETAALSALVSTETASPSPSIITTATRLTNGLRDFVWTMNKVQRGEAARMWLFRAYPGVVKLTLQSRPGKTDRVIATFEQLLGHNAP